MPNRPRATQPTHKPVEHVFPAWGVDVFESHHAAGWSMPEASHDFLKIVLVHEGSGRFETSDVSDPTDPASSNAASSNPASSNPASSNTVTECRRGDAIVVPIGVPHVIADSEGEPMSLYVVSVRPNVLDAACFEPTLLAPGVVRLGDHSAEKIERGMRRLLFEQTLDQPTTGAQMVALALRLLVDVARLTTGTRTGDMRAGTTQIARGSDSVTRMGAYVEDLSENFFEATNLDAAASTLGLSRRRFTQLFREITDTSWLAHVRKLRIDHAKKLLESTSRTVLSVAFECGFEDLSTFYRAFKRETGESPNKWRLRGEDQSADAEQTAGQTIDDEVA